MISKINWKHVLHCDICGEKVEKLFDDFFDAVDYKKKNGWKSQKHNDDWEDVCPECQCKG